MRGHTLLEMATVLVLVGVGVSAGVPTARRFADRAAVLAAREALIGAISETRTASLAGGGGVVVLRESPASAQIRVSGRPTIERSLEPLEGVVVDLGASGDSVVLRFDALGIGRFASRTISVARGGVTRRIVVSSYGRVRRR